MRVLLWVSTLQADILALALHLDSRPNCELLIATDGLAAYLAEPIARARPIRSRMLEREDGGTPELVRNFQADVVVCDNHFPEFAAAPRVCHLWHGLGWKATPPKDIRVRLGHIKRLTGMDPRKPNPRFLAQCYHDRDLQWRVESWGVAPANCRVVGSCFADLLRDAPYDRAQLTRHYRIPVGQRPIVLLSFTWHYGRIFPGSWQPTLFGASPMEADLGFIRSVCGRATDHGASVLLCLHDRWRYEPHYLEVLHREASRFPFVELKHKNERPDNLADLVVADAMVSNLSSFITFFYHFGRPTVHLCPPAGEAIRLSRVTRGKLRASRASELTWMNLPEDNGGLSAYDVESALQAIDRALTEPQCCVDQARSWLVRHVAAPPDGASAALGEALEELAGR